MGRGSGYNEMNEKQKRAVLGALLSRLMKECFLMVVLPKLAPNWVFQLKVSLDCGAPRRRPALPAKSNRPM